MYPRQPPQSPSATPSRASVARSNNDRHGSEEHYRRSSSDGSSSRPPGSSDRSRHTEKVVQIIQNLFSRAALVIVSSRANLTPTIDPGTKTPTTTSWFQLVLSTSTELNDQIEHWRYTSDVDELRKPLTIEIYLDIGELKRNQTLAVVDERGKKWDVCEALKLLRSRSRAAKDEVILERWELSLDNPSSLDSVESNENLATVYKHGTMTMRSLLSFAHLLPAARFTRRTMHEPAILSALRPQFRVVQDGGVQKPRDPLNAALYPVNASPCETHHFAPLRTPAGHFSIRVTYRKNCNFLVSDYETLASDAFTDEVDDYSRQAAETGVPGSLPVGRRWNRDPYETSQAYGSLGTWHQAGHTGTSPLSALRNAGDTNMPSPSIDDPPQKSLPSHRTSQSSKSSLKSSEQAPPQHSRRLSVSFQRKQGSLSSSPAQTASPGTSLTRGSDLMKRLAQERNIRPASQAAEVAVGSPASGSPKAPPMTRYSSSFGHRRSRFSSGGGSGSKEEDNSSSGRGSRDSSKKNSALLAEPEGGPNSGGSSGSVPDDDQNIGDFLKLLEQKKDLKSFNRTDEASRDATNKQTAAMLAKYRGQRETNNQLSESISSSVFHRSSGASSQRLSGVPPLIGPSLSTSSSPGKPVSPHTPHTPIVPSRLSEEATIREPSRHRGHSRPDVSSSDGTQDSSGEASNTVSSGAIPIPVSPQRMPGIRRSSSAHNRRRADLEDIDFDPRPSSMPLEERELSLSELLHVQHESDVAQRESTAKTRMPPAPVQLPDERQQHSSSPAASASDSAPSVTASKPLGPTHRPRLSRGGSSSTLSSRRGSTSRFSFSNRPGAGSTEDDEEPLLFTLSELSRRSLEELRPGSGRSKGARRGSSNPVGEDQGWSG